MAISGLKTAYISKHLNFRNMNIEKIKLILLFVLSVIDAEESGYDSQISDIVSADVVLDILEEAGEKGLVKILRRYCNRFVEEISDKESKQAKDEIEKACDRLYNRLSDVEKAKILRAYSKA